MPAIFKSTMLALALLWPVSVFGLTAIQYSNTVDGARPLGSTGQWLLQSGHRVTKMEVWEAFFWPNLTYGTIGFAMLAVLVVAVRNFAKSD